MGRFAVIALSVALLSLVVAEGNAAGIIDTRHNLSAVGPAGRTVYAQVETRICVFCHTPHNAYPETPLWNREAGPNSYTFYSSPTLRSPLPAQPTGATKLCLTCHDGTTGMGAVLNPAGGISMGSGTFPPGSLSNFTTDLRRHHPISFSYTSALPNAELAPTPPPNLLFGGFDDLQCTTCHDPHNDTYGKFLVMSNEFSALCTTCHQIAGWVGSAHQASDDSVGTVLPVYPKTWPNWAQVNQWGCEVCHTPHFAVIQAGGEDARWLLNHDASSTFCLSCHGAEVGEPHSASPVAVGSPQTASAPKASAPVTVGKRADIRRQIRKASSHGGRPGVDDRLHHPKESARSAVRHVTCADCHNPHVARKQKASAPNASGAVRGVKGVDRYGMPRLSAAYEYEICFRCHGDYTPGVPYVIRVVNTTNLRLAFDSFNPSYHPVVSVGRNLNIPSVPSSFEPSLNASVVMYCTDCHRDDAGGSKGPHGSSFAPILKERYEVADGTPESLESYILCYRCHERTSILNDVSFRKKTGKNTGNGGGHSGHLARGATCSACHDPHGVNPDSRPTGSHAHLINFDTRVVSPVTNTPNSFPTFHDTGTFSGSCTLVCHGVTHNNLSYP